ncbi:MAG: sulfatase [Pirellula sp.]|nr:sulfatase [Pirellula sp.]
MLKLLLGLPLIFAATCLANAAAADRPNILLIYADDLGYNELGCYGGKHVPTPNIDSLATGGVRLTQGYVSAPLCSPSRAGLMTGRYQTRFGHDNNTMVDGGLPLSEVTLGDRMKALGYATATVGKWHLGNASDRIPTSRGFNEYYGVWGNPGSYFKPRGFVDSRISTESRQIDDPKFYTTDAFAARAAEWIDQHKAAPWFLYLPFNAIHSPAEATEKYLNRFADVDHAGNRRLFAMTSAMDDAVGTVLGKIRELGLESNTLIFFISDNGAPGHPDGNGVLRGKKHTTWEGGIRVPFIVQWKGKLPTGAVYDLPAVQLDVMPTCVAAAGGTIDPKWKLDGVDLLPFLTGANKGRTHEDLFWRIDGMWAVRHGDLKLVNGDGGDDAPELFDLATDLSEQHNLAAEQPAKVKELRKLWDDWNAQQAEPRQAKEKVKPKEKRKKKRTK